MKNLKLPAIILSAAVLITAVFWAELHYMRQKTVPFFTKVVLFVLLNLNLVALLVLMFFVGKNLIKVYLERKHKVPGYRFKTKFVVVLVVLTLIPSAFLFIVSSGVVTNYLDRWFDPQIKQPLDLSVDVARSAYDIQRMQTLLLAQAIASGKQAPDQYRLQQLATLPEDASETVRAGFEGKAGAEVISGRKQDTVRAVAPVYKGNRQTGVIILESVISQDLRTNAEAIKKAYQNYMALESWKTPIKTNYLLVLGFFTLLTVFMALWAALRMARGITDPIRELALATEQVARGDLETKIDSEREDEIGLLVASFNRMVKDLKENKESLHNTWTASERRRLIIENILENINSGVIFLDETGTILTINSAASKILNVAPEDLINKNYAFLLTMLESDELKAAVKNIRVHEFKGIERELKVTAGNRRVLLRIFITTLGSAHNFLGTLAVFDDLTEIVKAQRALAWEEVARRIAHEIKNPLTPIKLSTDHMIKKWQNKDEDFGVVFERSTRTIIKEVESLKRLVNEFSRFGKMPEINKTPALVSGVIDSVVNLYRDYKDVSIKVLRPEGEPPVELDSEQFKRVIINIVDNAVQAMQSRGNIVISISHDQSAGRLYIDIADDGPGIREEDKERLFLPYFSTKKDGTGLGLAIAGRVITEHRGYIRIKDNKPTGTIFSIELPVKEG